MRVLKMAGFYVITISTVHLSKYNSLDSFNAAASRKRIFCIISNNNYKTNFLLELAI
jgi:hypothetical protein